MIDIFGFYVVEDGSYDGDSCSLLHFPCSLICFHRLLNKQIDVWGEKVTVVSSDMRKWEAPEKVSHQEITSYQGLRYI